MDNSNSEITTLAAIAEADAEVKETSGAGSDPAAKVDSTPEDKSKTDTTGWTEKAQERYHQLTREKYDALGERDRERYDKEQTRVENARLATRIAEFEKTAKTPEVAPPETFPTLEQYGYDEAKFVAAVTAYNKATTESAKEAAREAAREELRLEREADEAEQANKSWASKEDDFIKSKPDYVEKVRNNRSLPITPEMAGLIKDSSIGPQLAYHLAENTEKAAEIARLSPLAQAREIGRIEARLEAAKAPAPPPPVSQAPPPVAKVDVAETSLAGISTTSPDSDKMSDDAWVKAENARLARKNKRQGG